MSSIMDSKTLTDLLDSTYFNLLIDHEMVDFTKKSHLKALKETLQIAGLTEFEARKLVTEVENATKSKEDTEDIQKDAERKGVEHVAYGFYGKNGKVMYKSKDGKLVPTSDLEYQKAVSNNAKIDKTPPADQTDKPEFGQPETPVKPKYIDPESEKGKELAKKGNVASELYYDENSKSADNSDDDTDDDSVPNYENLNKKSKEIVKTLYGESGSGPLLQNSKDADDVLKYGFKKGAEWVAPGNAGSAFNETVSSEGVLVLGKYPNLSEAELTNVLFERIKNTKLAKQQSTTTVEGSDKGHIPDDIPTPDRDLYRSSIIAARSAMSKYKRSSTGKKAAQSQVNFGENTEMKTYGGTVSDLKRLENDIESSTKTFIHDAGTNKVYEIKKDVLKQWILSGGGGENAADSAVITKDENGNIIYDGWSDKKGLSDIQGNSTLADEYTKFSSRVKSLLSSGKIDKAASESAVQIISEYSKRSDNIEKNYSNAVYKQGEFFKTYSGANRERLVSIIKDQQEGYESAGTTNHVLELMRKNNLESHDELLTYLTNASSNNSMTAQERKVLSRLATAEIKYLKSSDSRIPDNLDTSHIISDAREEVLQLQRKMVDDLNGLKGRTSSGKSKDLGDLLGFQETVDFLHLDKMNEPSNENDYKSILKRNTHLVMAGIDVPPATIQSCLGVKDLNDCEDNFEIVNDERLIKDKTGSMTTGKVVYIYAVNKNGKRRFIAEKRYRSKTGLTGKTANTIQWSKNMRDCFDSKRNS